MYFQVSFHANRMFLFKKRLALSNSLTQLLHLGEHLEFEAVPSEVGSNINSFAKWRPETEMEFFHWHI